MALDQREVSLTYQGSPMIAAIIAAVILAFTSSASAVCAWVLWRQFPSGQWEAVQGFGSQKECYEALKTIAGVYTCLPDTVDPRGPKRSGQ